MSRERTIKLRPVCQEDEPFLYELYKLSRVEEFAPARLSESQFELLMRMQYAARKGSYESNYPDARHEIVVVDGADAGQVWFSQEESRVRVIDISIAGAFQNQGIGAAVMNDIIRNAQSAGVPVTCSVATNNPGSFRFHERLGFRVTGEDPMYIEMELRVKGAADEHGLTP